MWTVKTPCESSMVTLFAEDLFLESCETVSHRLRSPFYKQIEDLLVKTILR